MIEVYVYDNNNTSSCEKYTVYTVNRCNFVNEQLFQIEYTGFGVTEGKTCVMTLPMTRFKSVLESTPIVKTKPTPLKTAAPKKVKK